MICIKKLICLMVLISAAPNCMLSAQNAASNEDPFEIALQQVGLTKATLKFDYGDMSNFGGDKFVLPLFYALHSSPFKVEHYAKLYRDNLLQNCRSSSKLAAFCSQRLNEGIRRGLYGNPLERVKPLLAGDAPLSDAIIKLEAFYSIPMDQKLRAELQAKAKSVPLELQRMAALILYMCIDSAHYHRQAFANAGTKADLQKMYSRMIQSITSEDETIDFETEPFIEKVDFKYLYTPAQDLAMAVDFVSDSLGKMSFSEEFEFEWSTYLGKVVLRDKRDHEYKKDEYLLIIDVGGNDRYENAAANMSVTNWISIAIDLSGDDLYQAPPEIFPSFGGGAFGYAFLVDLAGSDKYIGKYLSQGVGLCGVGMLIDRNGQDSYDSYVCAQGAGYFGQGVLTDADGDDHYHLYQMGQGFGFTKGCGLLIDSAGNDIYIAEDSIIDFPASQTKDHNSSFAQGIGFGQRADFIDGHSWAGGMGMLADGHGNDRYSAGLFAQGCGCWYAIGILADLQGNDTYNGVWYVQGSGAHFGLGFLLESAGDDVYTATLNMALGAGHDFTLGMLIDEDGNDHYNAPNLSLGGGNDNGIGIFWDKQGDDIYSVTAATTLGRSNLTSRGTLRDYNLCLGLFLDTGGEDRYPQDSKYSFAGNNRIWRQFGANTERPLEIEKGVGYDCEAGNPK